ncbi:MAG: flagellar biosynthetic protein FliO [Desulfurella sp.]|uniref:flagellar biosynthetic protein FliO n=1 Tax=Desulfurella sp. TaxID=1962857 RepID=UPI003D14539F
MRTFFIFVFFILIPSLAYAGSIDYLGYSLKALGSVIIVIALLFASVWALKKLQINTKRGGRIKILDRTYIDNKHSLVIIEVDEKQFLLGVGNEINLISQLVKNEENN